MSLRIQYTDQLSSLQWGWPIHLGLVSDIAQDNAALLAQAYTKKFGRISLIDDQIEHVHILLATDPLTFANEFSKHPIRCDVLLFIVNDSYLDQHSDASLKNILESFSVTTHAGILFILERPENLSAWFEQFMRQLSLNHTVTESMKLCSENGYGLCNPLADRSTRLSFLLEDLLRIMQRLEKSHPQKIKISSTLVSTGFYTLRELRQAIVSRLPDYQFITEGTVAEGIAALLRNLNEGLGLDNMLTERKDMPTSTPPDIKHRGEPQSSGSEPIDTATASTEKKISAPRYLQAAFKDTDDQNCSYLLPSKPYLIRVRIANYAADWKQSTQSFPDDKVFTNDKQTLESLQIQLISNQSTIRQSDTIKLPRKGNSTEAVFEIETQSKAGLCQAELFVYHQNKLIQKAVLSAQIIDAMSESANYPPAQLEIAFSLITDLNNLDKQPQFGASILIDPDKSPETAIQGIHNGAPIDLYFSNALEKLMQGIRDRIEQAVIHIDDHPEDLFHPANQTLLRQLALDGNQLFVNHLKRQETPEGPIQLISKKSEFIPFDFVYTMPPPDRDAAVCPNAIKALEAGTCQSCPGMQQSPATYICPLGFWGMRHVIERQSASSLTAHHQGDYTIIPVPTSSRNTLHVFQKTLFAASEKVSNADPAVTKKVKATLRSNIDKTLVAKNWKEWDQLIEKEHPDSLVLMVHIEHDEDSGQDQVEIGKEDYILQNYLDSKRIGAIEGQSPPFIILIGCEASKIDMHGFDISSQLIHQGAAVVVSNFTKIRGRQAGPIVSHLIQLIKKKHTEPISLGKVMLVLRQQLLAKGIIVSLALLTLGDAEWKLKT